jgi:uncharacterized protein (TIGR02594 family)
MLKWLDEARRHIGLKELPGLANNPTILHWGSRLGVKVLGIPYTSDSTAWCGLFTAWCVHHAGITPPAIAIRAKAWATWGDALSTTATRPPLGCVAVFGRDGGGHVGFVESVNTDGSLNILGGNQGDAVNVRRFARARLLDLRWPKGVARSSPAPWAGAAAADTTGEG